MKENRTQATTNWTQATTYPDVCTKLPDTICPNTTWTTGTLPWGPSTVELVGGKNCWGALPRKDAGDVTGCGVCVSTVTSTSGRPATVASALRITPTEAASSGFNTCATQEPAGLREPPFATECSTMHGTTPLDSDMQLRCGGVEGVCVGGAAQSVASKKHATGRTYYCLQRGLTRV